MKSIRLGNFRSLVDTGDFPLRPLTILVGANSSGKSTFLRSFPLLRQSIEQPRVSPALWSGRMVDFGSIEDVLTRDKVDSPTTLSFTFPTYTENEGDPSQRRFWSFLATPDDVSVSIEISRSRDQEGSRLSACSIRFGESTINLDLSDTGRVTKFQIDGKHSVLPTALELSTQGPAYFIPTIGQRSPDAPPLVFSPYSASQPIFQRRRGHLFPFHGRAPLLLDSLIDELRPMFHGNTKTATIRATALRLRAGSPSAILSQLTRLRADDKWTAALSSISNTYKLRKITHTVLGNWTAAILEAIDSVIADFASSIVYIRPVRATAQRWYPLQDLAVNEIDPQGSNLAMFLRSLAPPEREDLSSFCREYFGFDVSAKTASGQVALEFRDSDAHGSQGSINLADVGFGYSQLLPVIVQTWSAFARPTGQPLFSAKRRRLIALEQPELHLHPSFQAKLANLFVGAIEKSSQSGTDLNLVVETHSEDFVNRVGQLVGRGQIAADDVRIAIFERDPASRHTKVRFASYDPDGALRDWPFGFFSPDPQVDAHDADRD